MIRPSRPSAALVVAVLALVLAVAGSATAAGHYLIRSKSQIAPSVRKALRGQRGPAGPRGATGKTGPAGPASPGGLPGTVASGTALAPVALPYGGGCPAKCLPPTRTLIGTATVTMPATGHVVVDALVDLTDAPASADDRVTVTGTVDGTGLPGSAYGDPAASIAYHSIASAVPAGRHTVQLWGSATPASAAVSGGSLTVLGVPGG